MYIVEPIIIQYEENNWTHPEIENIVAELKDEDQINEGCGVYAGPWVRIYLEQNGKTLYTVCTFLEKEAYENHLKYCYEKFNEETYNQELSSEITNEILGFLYVSLVEDVWAPGGEQFCFSDYAEKMYENFDFSSEFKISMFTPDVGVENNGDHWIWCS